MKTVTPSCLPGLAGTTLGLTLRHANMVCAIEFRVLPSWEVMRNQEGSVVDGGRLIRKGVVFSFIRSSLAVHCTGREMQRERERDRERESECFGKGVS